MRTLLIAIFISLSFVNSAQARLFDLDQAYSLMEVLDNVFDASLDTNNYFDITENDDLSHRDYACDRVTNELVFNRIVSSFAILSEVYPDEEFPLELAKNQLQFILGNSPYYKCSLEIDENLDEGLDDVVHKDLYISMGTGISFILESSRF